MSIPTDFSDRRFLIIGGTSKAGTTSVFNYLAGHPQICATEAKETRFFLDADYPLPSAKRYYKDGPGEYLSFFDFAKEPRGEAWSLEATPDYLYSPNAPRLIRETLPNVRLIFFLREPISRLLSFYQFGKQINEIPQAMTFDQYVNLQRTGSGAYSSRGYCHPAYRALQHGRYSTYLSRFLEVFDRSAIYVAFYEELKCDARLFMVSICQWAGIDWRYFRDYRFEVTNQGVKMRSPRLNQVYYEAKQKARRLVRNRVGLRSILGQVGAKVNVIYRKMNVTNRNEVLISRSTEDFLSRYYGEEAARLKKMLGIEAPWPNRKT
ncbi:MAG: sulfotransferase [Chthoniobacterales bacterium]|jgi:hypothetical protein|nr:sulfotransferase [Chthoniobacterales bacterium]